MYHTSIGLSIYILVIAFMFGTVLGSFIDCMAWRIVKQESVLRGRSHCDVCGHVLGAADLIPIVSYIKSRGKCRYCGAKISSESTWVELLLGLCFVALVYSFDISFLSLRFMGLSVILFGLSLIDLKTYTIPDRFHVAGIVWWVITLLPVALTKGRGVTAYISGIPDVMLKGTGELIVYDNLQKLNGVSVQDVLMTDLKYGLMSGLMISVFMLLISLLFDRMTGKESLGGGDIKLFFMTGLYLRPWTAVFNLILSCFVGLFFVVVLKKDKIPFGPSIAIATLITILIGEGFVTWYLGLLA